MFLRFENVEFFLLVLIRITSLIMLMPALGYSQIPARVKITLGLVVTLLVIPVIPASTAATNRSLWEYAGLVFEQMAVGVVFGFAANFLFMAVQLSGQVMGMQMGFGIVSVLDPESQVQVSLIGQLENLFFLVVFLALNGHHLLLQVMQESFLRIPPGALVFHRELFGQLLKLSGEVFSWAIRLGAPVIAALFLTEAAMGIVARTVPQMNIFIVGFPLKILVGFLLLIAATPIMVVLFQSLLEQVSGQLSLLMQLMG